MKYNYYSYVAQYPCGVPVKQKSQSEIHLLPVWPDWTIYCIFGQLFKVCGNNYFAQIAHIIWQFLQKSLIFLVKLFLGNFYRRLATFYWSHCSYYSYFSQFPWVFSFIFAGKHQTEAFFPWRRRQVVTPLSQWHVYDRSLMRRRRDVDDNNNVAEYKKRLLFHIVAGGCFDAVLLTTFVSQCDQMFEFKVAQFSWNVAQNLIAVV